MGLLDSVIGGLMGGSGGSSPLAPILSSLLGGGMGGGQSGLAGLVQRFTQAGHGDAVNSWVGNGPNQPIAPDQLHQVFGQDQVNQWSQQTGMAPHDILSQLSQFLPHAVDQMTPGGHIPAGDSDNAFGEAGVSVGR